MLRIDLKVDNTQLLLRLQNGQKKLAYAVVNAINATAKRIQQAEFAEVKDSFEIRKPTFFFGTDARKGGAAARIKPFASVPQGRPFAEIAISPPEGRGLVSHRTLLPYFEGGGPRPIFTPGAHHVAVPIIGGPARPSWPSSVPQAFTFAGMHLAAYQHGKRVKKEGRRRSRTDQTLWDTSGRAALPELAGTTQWKGLNRTFVILSERDRASGVYQRTGAKAIRMVYSFEDPKQLEKRLLWLYTAKKVADTWFKEDMEVQAHDALSHSGGRGL